MEKNKLMVRLVLFLGLAFSLVNCVKHDDFYSTKVGDESNRKTVVQISGASGLVQFARDVKSTPDTFALIDIVRSPNSEADLNQPLTVKLTKNAGLITAYNTANSANFVELPSNAYTLSSDISTVTFQPGEAVKSIKISVDQSKLDLSQQYALGFSITDGGSNTVVNADAKNALYGIGVKNKYDGKYSVVSGTVTRYTSPGVPAGDALSGSVAGNPDVTLTTVGANTVEVTNLQWANSGGGVGGIANLRLTVDPATNLVTVFALGNATLANWAGQVNKYDPATKTFTLGFKWNPTSTVREYQMVIKYKGPR